MIRNPFYGTAFLAIAGALAYLAARGGVYWLLAWPTLSFALVSIAYWTGSVKVFGKRPTGERSIVANALLWPYLAFARLVWELQILVSREPAWQRIGASLIVARRLRLPEAPGDVAVFLDLTSELLDPPALRSLPGYRCVPILDANAVTAEKLVELVRGIPVPSKGRVLIHCANGSGRTGFVATAWLICHGMAKNSADAITILQVRRACIRLTRIQRKALDGAGALLATGESFPGSSQASAEEPRTK